MKRKYIEYKIAEYPQMTDKGLAWIVLYRIEYINYKGGKTKRVNMWSV